MAKEIDERVTSAWKRFGQYSTFLRDQRMPMCLKRKIMNTVILPSMTYGAETWSLTNRQREKLAVTQRSMERSMLGVTRRDKIRNEDLRSRTGQAMFTDLKVHPLLCYKRSEHALLCPARKLERAILLA
eukprot:gene6542-12026_t